MIGIGDRMKYGVIVIGADALFPIIDAGGRSLAGDLLYISDAQIALFIDGVAKPLLGPSRFRQNFCALRIEHENMGSGGGAVAFDIVRDGGNVVFDRRCRKAARYDLAISAQHRYRAILRFEPGVIDVKLIPGISLFARPLGDQGMPARGSAVNGLRKLPWFALPDIPKN